MDPQIRPRPPKGQRRVRFADSMGMELVSIFLFDFISNYYFASIHQHKQIQPPPPPLKAYHLAAPPPVIKNYNNNNNNSNTSNTNRNSNNTTKNSTIITTDSSAKATKNAENIYNINSNNHSNSNNANQNHHTISTYRSLNQQEVINKENYLCEFTQPLRLLSFKERVKLNKVHLETCDVNSRAGYASVSCTIRVLNVSYEKSVIVRYTTDEWHTHTDSLASYKPGSYDGWSDKFTSTFSVTTQGKQVQRIIFAIMYKYDGDKVSWDNNGGLNYVLKKI